MIRQTPLTYCRVVKRTGGDRHRRPEFIELHLMLRRIRTPLVLIRYQLWALCLETVETMLSLRITTGSSVTIVQTSGELIKTPRPVCSARFGKNWTKN